MALPPASEPHLPQSPKRESAGSLAGRVWEATKTLITIGDHLKTLEIEDGRLQAQVQELARVVLDLVKEVRESSGQMKSIDKRFDDKDKMVEAVIKLRVREEIERLQAKGSNPA
jgi:hypothetical protein